MELSRRPSNQAQCGSAIGESPATIQQSAAAQSMLEALWKRAFAGLSIIDSCD
jgi:hypothetical protein